MERERITIDTSLRFAEKRENKRMYPIYDTEGKIVECRFANGTRLDYKIIEKTCDDILKTIKNRIPEEFHSYEVIKCILEEATIKADSLGAKL